MEPLKSKMLHNSTTVDDGTEAFVVSTELAMAIGVFALSAFSVCLGCLAYLLWRHARQQPRVNSSTELSVSTAAARPTQNSMTIEAIEQSALESVCRLPASTWEDAAGEPGCALCLEAFEVGALVCRLRCAHAFHHACVHKWLVVGQRYQKRRCPLCGCDPLAADLGTAGTRSPTAWSA